MFAPGQPDKWGAVVAYNSVEAPCCWNSASENYAVVEKVRVRFHRGLNLLTGETGSGKSIVVDALALLLGARAAAEMVRSGAERARISGIFEVDGQTLPEGVEAEDGELIIEREILPNGKSRAFAGGRPVTAALLERAGAQPRRYPRPA